MRRVIVLGSTGSIGRAALDVMRDLGPAVHVAGLSARRDIETLAQQVREFRPAAVAVESPGAADALREAVPAWRGEVFCGPDALAELASGPPADVVLVAVVGIAGLVPTLAALAAGRDVALATKEVLVAAGAFVMGEAARTGSRVLPVDSEPSAILQCLVGRDAGEVARVWLTASGGPFLRTPASAMGSVTPAEALRHPTWRMGSKVTIDSATLMNKGFEVIEAHCLFDIPADRIEVVIHPQSLVHSCVELVDGAVLAQLGPRDMRLPIQYALTYPERRPSSIAPLDLRQLGTLGFEAPDPDRFPLLGYAREALGRGGTALTALGAADEVAVQLFLEGRIGFLEIARIIRRVLDHHHDRAADSLERILEADREARVDAAAPYAPSIPNHPRRIRIEPIR
ncbi:MAG TPA: 1-deoxy-D-xylulose-5-phosphate reductoisomerase [bacterium]|nr:1-deoxy-D-xylulose-5-phosphate reductoisomerase [bacterium]